jgi:quinol-cytochrome oxidoreductase complex cytochrome b subunit
MLGVLFLPESFQKSTDEFTSFQTKPLWFLLPCYHASGLVSTKVWYVTIFSIYALAFVTVPFIDRNPERRLWKKPVFFSIVAINLLMILVFGLMKHVSS